MIIRTFLGFIIPSLLFYNVECPEANKIVQYFTSHHQIPQKKIGLFYYNPSILSIQVSFINEISQFMKEISFKESLNLIVDNPNLLGKFTTISSTFRNIKKSSDIFHTSESEGCQVIDIQNLFLEIYSELANKHKKNKRATSEDILALLTNFDVNNITFRQSRQIIVKINSFKRKANIMQIYHLLSEISDYSMNEIRTLQREDAIVEIEKILKQKGYLKTDHFKRSNPNHPILDNSDIPLKKSSSPSSENPIPQPSIPTPPPSTHSPSPPSPPPSFPPSQPTPLNTSPPSTQSPSPSSQSPSFPPSEPTPQPFSPSPNPLFSPPSPSPTHTTSQSSNAELHKNNIQRNSDKEKNTFSPMEIDELENIFRHIRSDSYVTFGLKETENIKEKITFIYSLIKENKLTPLEIESYLNKMILVLENVDNFLKEVIIENNEINDNLKKCTAYKNYQLIKFLNGKLLGFKDYTKEAYEYVSVQFCYNFCLQNTLNSYIGFEIPPRVFCDKYYIPKNSEELGFCLEETKDIQNDKKRECDTDKKNTCEYSVNLNKIPMIFLKKYKLLCQNSACSFLDTDSKQFLAEFLVNKQIFDEHYFALKTAVSFLNNVPIEDLNLSSEYILYLTACLFIIHAITFLYKLWEKCLNLFKSETPTPNATELEPLKRKRRRQSMRDREGYV